jgi:peptide/nickel transport system permease protein
MRETWRSYIMPGLTLGLVYFGFATQAVRATTLIIIRNDRAGLAFFETDEGEGHNFQNAISLVVAKSGLQLGWLFGAVIIVEMLFAIPGVGRMLIQGLRIFDVPVCTGSIMALSTHFLAVAAIIGAIFAVITIILRAARKAR